MKLLLLFLNFFYFFTFLLFFAASYSWFFMILHTWVLSILKTKIISYSSLEVIVCEVLSVYLPPLSPPLLAHTERISSLNCRLLCTLLAGEGWNPSHVTWFSALYSFPLATELLPGVIPKTPSTSPYVGSGSRALHAHMRISAWSTPNLNHVCLSSFLWPKSHVQMVTDVSLRTQVWSGWWVLPCHHAPTSFSLLTHCSRRATSYCLLPRTHLQHHMQALL